MEAGIIQNHEKGGRAESDGEYVKVFATGKAGSACTHGKHAWAVASGFNGRAYAMGYHGKASVWGDYGLAFANGRYGLAFANGEHCEATATGKHGRVNGMQAGCKLVFWHNAAFKYVTEIVGKNGIKPNTWYGLEDGKFTEAEDEFND